MVRQPRTWRWSPSRERGWHYPRWAHEVLDDGEATWFARMARTTGTTRPPVVLVHGVVVSGAYFQPVAEHLHGQFHIYVPDLPGTGRSKTHGTAWDIERLAGELGRWMDLHQLRDAVLVSNSIGCQVLTMLAAERPDLAHSLILVSPTMDPSVSSVIRVMIRGIIDMPREDVGLWKIWLPDLVRTGPLRGLRLLRVAMRDPQLARLGEIKVPVIVVGGERDPIAPVQWVKSLAARIPCGRAVIIPKAPHAMNYSSPRHLARIIRAAVGDWPDDAVRKQLRGQD
ncbi:MAG: alpha/beta fold hydrolase [Chloroflexia bacterium]|nr:alpha/beta fold hydrolase [Chloroflexia bacterium]